EIERAALVVGPPPAPVVQLLEVTLDPVLGDSRCIRHRRLLRLAPRPALRSIGGSPGSPPTSDQPDRTVGRIRGAPLPGGAAPPRRRSGRRAGTRSTDECRRSCARPDPAALAGPVRSTAPRRSGP